ncbi:MAG: hypothetical protein MAG795_00517 [Candidatus Woesearchaeota archaeon]|nr:hypothetical protein [Candidatus Woesearchaeota archaeon]
MYKDVYSSDIVKKLKKLKKKDSKVYTILRKKMDWILNNPNHRFKNLRHSMKGINRVQLGGNVLIFVINHKKRTVSFEDFDHHDKIYY